MHPKKPTITRGRGAVLRRAATIAFGLTLLVSAVATAPATATTPAGKSAATGSFIESTEVPGGFASWADLLRIQHRMNTAAERIIRAVQRGENSGFAGIIADPTNRELRVYWKGEAPAALITTTRGIVPTRVLPAAHSQRELLAVAARLRAKVGDKITTVGPRADGAGLLVGTQNGLRGAAKLAGVPVTVQTGVAAAPATRWDDTAPWWGGAAWRNATAGGGCSTGFAVYHGGVQRMLSAGHCADVNQIATDPTGQVIGPVVAANTFTDTLIIAGYSAGRVFNNSIDAFGGVVSEFSNPVIGGWASQVGNWVCTSGAYSGTRCGIQVVARDLCINVRGIGIICGQVQAENVARTNAAGEGDSGGPVEFVNPYNLTQVYATGTNTAIDTVNTSVPCTGYVPTGRVCAWRVYYEDIYNGMLGVGATGLVLG